MKNDLITNTFFPKLIAEKPIPITQRELAFLLLLLLLCRRNKFKTPRFAIHSTEMNISQIHYTSKNPSSKTLEGLKLLD
jgi:hypothetical protein